MVPTSSRNKKYIGLAIILVVTCLPFLLLYSVSRRAIINEVRAQAMGVAIAASAGLPVGDFARVIAGDDPQSNAFSSVQQFINRVSRENPDVRYVYTMRRSANPLNPAWMVEYVVDQPAHDHNRDGQLDASEQFEPMGTVYNASRSPELINAFFGPTADFHITPDPPYPDLISGYAPIRDDTGTVLGIVGVDVTARTVANKLLVMQVVMLLVWLVIGALILCVYLLYQKQREGYERISQLSSELLQRNEMLRAANQELARMNTKFESERQLAQRVQQGFLPTRFPRHDRIVFDQYYLTCEILGGDLYDVFEIDQDHVGLYMAEVAGQGVSAALVSGLLKMAVATIRQQRSAGTASLFVDMTKPDVFLRCINQLLVKEMPAGEFITLIYGVFDLMENRLLLASAGHPHPVIYSREKQSAFWCSVKNGKPLGLELDQDYTCTSQAIAAGDLILFYTDGLTEAVNKDRVVFGEERLLDLMGQLGQIGAARLNDAVKEAVETHRAGCPVSDDFTLLSVEIR